MSKAFIAVFRNISGATAIEYSLIAGAIALVIIGTTGSIGETLMVWFQALADAL